MICDTLLSLAYRPLFVPQWSQQILDEMERNVARLLEPAMGSEKAAAAAKRRREQMELAFPDAAINEFDDLIGTMTNHEKDRHVLAAAVRGRVDLIVTANVSDFPAAATAPYGIAVMAPDAFLMDVLGFDEALVVNAIRE